MTTREHLAPVLSELAEVVDAITDEQSTLPTPCSEYTVADLRGHVLGWLTAFTDGYSSDDGVCSDPEAVAVDGTGGDQIRTLRDRLDAALAEGADQRPLKIGEAGMPGDMAAQMILWEYQVHGWDLARATGRRWSPDEAGVQESLDFAPGMLTPDYQGEGKSFAPRVEVPADAPAIDRLVGLSGRDPQWEARS